LQPKSKRLQPKLRTKLLRILLIIIVIVGVSFTLYFLVKSKFWLVRKVVFSSNAKYIDNEKVKITSEVLGKSIFTINDNKYVQLLKQNPYVSSTYIVKRFPGEIDINVLESNPASYLFTLNKALILGAKGNILSQTSLDDNYDISETERLMYFTSFPFKNDLVKNKWKADNLVKLQANFTAIQKSTTKPILPPVAPQPTTIDDYADQQYSLLSPADLTKYYNLVKQGLTLNINSRWHDLTAKYNLDKSLPIAYSLLEYNQLFYLQPLIQINYVQVFEQGLVNQFSINRYEYLSSELLKVSVTRKIGTNNLNINLLFNVSKNISEQINQLNILILTLDSNKQAYQNIDLSGQKIVVS